MNATVITGENITTYHLLCLKSALKLETMGMSFSRKNASAAKQVRYLLGVKTRDKKQLLQQLEEYLENLKGGGQ